MSRVTLVLNSHAAPSETFQRSLIRALAEAGHEVTSHALRFDPNPAPVPADDPAVRSWAMPQMSQRSAVVRRLVRAPKRDLVRLARHARRRWGWTRRAALAAWIAAPIAATRPDVIHVGFSGIGIAIQDALDLLVPTPVVVSCRGTDELVRPITDPDRPVQLHTLFERADIVHAVADAVADVVIGFGADRAKVRVIRPAVDLDGWRRADPLPDELDADAPLRLVAVARMVAAKGLDDLVEGLAIAVEHGVDAHLRIIGDGPHRDPLRLCVVRLDLADRVTFTGTLPPEEVRRELVEANVFVSPSLSEGISNVVLEAMALGVPVVSTEVGGMAEVITSGTDGLLVPAGRPDRIGEAIVRLANAPELRRSLATAGRRRVEAEFASPAQFAAWCSVYDDLPGGTGGSFPDPHGREGNTR